MTWQENAEEVVALKKNPLSDINRIKTLVESLQWVNMNGLSAHDFNLLNQALTN